MKERHEAMEARSDAASCLRLRLAVYGAVQGVGFRPFVYRLARALSLNGWVRNTPAAALLEVEGAPDDLNVFLRRIREEAPPPARIQRIESHCLEPSGYRAFRILESDTAGVKSVRVPPDIATCRDCLTELFDPRDRRYRYPFINCSHCGPRYSIIVRLPYDRRNTTMSGFVMCAECRSEYENPARRRFHAQPNACPGCGPRLAFLDAGGHATARDAAALDSAVALIRTGGVVAVKGVGGFHLIVDARDDRAVQTLRRRKGREARPFALMAPDMETVEGMCLADADEKRLIESPEAPIVLLRRSPDSPVAPAVAPGNPFLGVMLPYSPLHHLLMNDLGFPVVATSGNRSEEPICVDETEALHRLNGIADGFLVHDRSIFRPVDDSVARVVDGQEMTLRLARGYAPHPVTLPLSGPSCLAVGGHLKTSIAVTRDNEAIISPHIGDLDTLETIRSYARTIQDMKRLHDIEPEMVVCDRHPDYRSVHYATRHNQTPVSVQHHHAHILACMAEHQLEEPVLGVAWDGSGYGGDGTVWGGEFLLVRGDSFTHIARMRRFHLPGGEAATREPRRSALGVLYELYGEEAVMQDLPPVKACSPNELEMFIGMMRGNAHAPLTSSVGRLFDAVASLLNLRQITGFEGEAAMALEYAIVGQDDSSGYPVELHDADGEPIMLDWKPMMIRLIEDIHRNVDRGCIARRFHDALAFGVVSVAGRVGMKNVALSGGCFQNLYLIERAIRVLRERGFEPYWPRRIPPNDGGLSLGQAVFALMKSKTEG